MAFFSDYHVRILDEALLAAEKPASRLNPGQHSREHGRARRRGAT